MRKRILSILLCMVMFLMLAPEMAPKAGAFESVNELESYANAHWVKPLHGGVRLTDTFGSSRDDGRKHAAIDLWTGSGVTPVYAMTDGEVILYSYNYYGGTDLLLVKNDDGSVLAYGEVSSSLRAGDRVSAGQQIATLKVNSISNSQCLHLELYYGTYGNGYLYNGHNTGNEYWYITPGGYQRRPDLLDPSFLLYIIEPIVGQGYNTSGAAVRKLQHELNVVCGAGLDEDGIFGIATKGAVVAYQNQKGLTADGICGDATWAVLDADYNSRVAEYCLDLNAVLDGTLSGALGSYGTADVYINDVCVGNDVTDWYVNYTAGTKYKITDIKPAAGITYNGLDTDSAAIQGTVEGPVYIKLVFGTIITSILPTPAARQSFNGHTYALFKNTVTWYTANEWCKAMGGHLAYIESAEENAFLHNLCGEAQVWMGGTDAAGEGSWYWTNGRAFSYTNWYSGQPDNYFGNHEGCENYLNLREDGSWNDNAGCALLWFVCEIESLDSYPVTYDANGGSGAPAAQVKTHGAALTLSTTVPTRAGYWFKGWATSASGAAAYQPGGQYTQDASATLYAVWTENPKLTGISLSGGRVTVTIAGEVPEGCRLILAAYDENGRMLNLAACPASEGGVRLNYSGAYKVTAFLMDGGYAPLCEPIHWIV